jgi:uncharacterized protein
MRDRAADGFRVSRFTISTSSGSALRGLAALAFAACATIASAQKLSLIPSPSLRVNDNVSLLGAPQEAALDESLADYERRKGTKIVVLTVASTAPESIDQYGARAAEAWRIGRPGGAGDVLIIVARDNREDQRRVDIQVAPDLRQRLPEQALSRIANEDFAPHFEMLDYNGGIVAAIDHIKLLLEGGALPAPPRAPVRAVAPVAVVAPVAEVSIALVAAGLLAVLALVFVRATARHMLYLAGNRTLNRAFSPMIVGRVGGKRVRFDDDGNGFGGGYVGPGVGGYAGGGGDFGGRGASGDW